MDEDARSNPYHDGHADAHGHRRSIGLLRLDRHDHVAGLDIAIAPLAQDHVRSNIIEVGIIGSGILVQ
jgi:hypothetical protein